MFEVCIRRIERNVMRSLFADGLWEMFAGYLVLQLALISLAGNLGLGNFLGSLIWLPVYWLVFRGVIRVKEKWIAPRIGRVRLHKSSASGRELNRWILVALVLANLAATIMIFSSVPPKGWNRPAAMALFMLMAFSGASMKLRVPRLMTYGWLCSGAIMTGEWLYRVYDVGHHGISLAMGICGGVILISGLLRMVLFLHNNPRQGMGKMG